MANGDRTQLMEMYDSEKYWFREDGDRNLRQGPRKERRCTDLVCLILFAVSFVCVIGYTAYGATQSHMSVLSLFTHPIDYEARRCGRDTMKDYKYVFHVVEGEKFQPVCTKRCPEKGTGPVCHPDDSDICEKYKATETETDTVKIMRFCLPTNTWSSLVKVHNWLWSSTMGWMNDIAGGWKLYLVGIGISVITSICLLVFLKHCSSILLWASILVCLAGFTGIAIGTFTQTEELEKHGIGKTAAYTIGGISATLAITTLLGVVCGFNTIRMSSKLSSTASYFLIDVKSQMIQPFIFIFLYALFLAFWITCVVILWTIKAEGGESYDKCCIGGKCTVTASHPFCVKYSWEDSKAFYVFVGSAMFFFFWVSGVISALSQFTTAYAAGVWYYAGEDSDGVRDLPGGNTFCDFRLTWAGMAKGVWYHTGTFSFGAFLCALCWLLNMILSKIAMGQKDGNCVVKVLVACTQCATYCLTKCIGFISSQAYIHTALLGTGFCESAKSGFSVVVRHPTRTFAATRLGTLIRWSCGLMNVAVVVTAGFFLQRVDAFGSEIINPTPPLVVLGIIVLVISWCVMHPFSVAVLAIMHCFCADEEMSKHAGRSSAHHAPPALRSILENMEGYDRFDDQKEKAVGQPAYC